MRRPGVKDAIGTFAAFLYSLPAWSYPFGNDQSLHWYIGDNWLDGTLPFVSAISSKPIGMFAVHALSTALFGSGMWPIRVTESLTVLLVGWLVALSARRLGEPGQDGEWGLGAMLFSGIYYTFYDYWDTAHPELWMSTCALAAFVVALRARTPWTRDAGAGALATAAFMFKYPAALPALGVSALCALRAYSEREPGEGLAGQVRGGAKAVLWAAGRFLCGVLPVVLLVLLPFVLGGGLKPMWEILGVYIFHYAEQAPPVRGLPAWFRIERGGLLFLLTFVLTSMAAVTVRERRDRDGLWRLSWVAVGAVLALLSVIAQKRYFPYHFVAIGSFCAALCAIAIRIFPRTHGAPSWTTLGVSALVIAGVFYFAPTSGLGQSYRGYVKSLIAYRTGETDRDAMLRGINNPRSLDSPLFVEHVAARINALKKPGDTLCARGFLTPLHPLTGLRCPSRHIVEENVNTGLPDWRREYRETLEKHPPTFMVTFSDRPRDVKYLQDRGYILVYQEHIFRVFSTRPAPAGFDTGAPRR
ncbi:MAG: glycosyltransferase family 39 protein [Myxococcales bacterium]